MALARHRLTIVTVALSLFFIARSAQSQTSPDLLVKPWDEGQRVDSSSEGTFEAASHTKETDSTIRISSIHEFGRWRVLPDNVATPRIGYDFLYYDLPSNDKVLPKHLWNVSVGFAQPIAKFGPWFAVLTGAVGYAGNSLFDDPHALYGRSDLIVGRQFGPDHALIVALDYDGNRTYLPEVPIPGIAYTNRFNNQLKYVVGFPYSSITYEPQSGFQLEAGFTLVTTFEARVGYEFVKHFTIFGDYNDRLTPFQLDNFKNDRRLFLQTHDVEIGVRWNPTELIRLSVGGGWAFGQEFSYGFDSRSLNSLRHIGDAPFGRVLVEIGF